MVEKRGDNKGSLNEHSLKHDDKKRRKVKPDFDEDVVSVTQFRNENFIKNMEKQQAISIPSLKVHKVQKKKVKESPLEGLQPAKSSESVTANRIDAVVATVVIAQIVGCLAISFEAYAYSLDQHWNQIVQGNRKIEEVGKHTVFADKTLDFKNHDWLLKSQEFLIRDEHQEIIFIVFLVIFIGASFIQIWTCYVRFVNFEQFSTLLIIMYAVGGALCMFSSTFLVSAATNIENNYMYAADMLYNFQHMFDNYPPVSNTSDCDKDNLMKGCEGYEFAKSRAKQLEEIFRLCGEGSRYTRYYRDSKATSQWVRLDGETYYRHELKEMGFCSRDGFKFVAALFAILMGIVCSVVPVVYCCEGRAVYREPPSTVEQEVKKLPQPKGMEGKKKDEPPPRGRVLKPNAAVDQWTTYVEKESDEELKHMHDLPTENFTFIKEDQ